MSESAAWVSSSTNERLQEVSISLVCEHIADVLITCIETDCDARGLGVDVTSLEPPADKLNPKCSGLWEHALIPTFAQSLKPRGFSPIFGGR